MIDIFQIKPAIERCMPGWKCELIREAMSNSITVYISKTVDIINFISLERFANALSPPIREIQQAADKMRRKKRPIYRPGRKK